MREVNSRVIKAYARSLESLARAVEDDLTMAIGEHAANSFRARLHEISEDLLITARDIALEEFSRDWGKM